MPGFVRVPCYFAQPLRPFCAHTQAHAAPEQGSRKACRAPDASNSGKFPPPFVLPLWPRGAASALYPERAAQPEIRRRKLAPIKYDYVVVRAVRVGGLYKGLWRTRAWPQPAHFISDAPYHRQLSPKMPHQNVDTVWW